MSPPELLEFLRLATQVPTASILATLRFSLMDSIGNPIDELWRQVTFTSATSMGVIAGAKKDPSKVRSESFHQQPLPTAASCCANVLYPESELPSFWHLHSLGSPWQMLLAHNIVTSRRLMASLTGSSFPTPLPSPAGARPLRLHIVVEIDAEDPKSHYLFQRRVDTSLGQDLVALLVEEVQSLLPGQMECSAAAFNGGGWNQFQCTLDLVLISNTVAMRNLQSASQVLFRTAVEVVEEYAPPTSASQGSAKEKPTWLSMMRVHLADECKWTFASLNALTESIDNTRHAPPVDVRCSNAFIVLLRNPTQHTEFLTQLGHILYPFAAAVPDALGSTPSMCFVDCAGSLVLDANQGSEDEKKKPATAGITVQRSFLKLQQRFGPEKLFAHLTRHILRCSCGEAKGESRLVSITSPMIIFRLGTPNSISLIPQLASTQRQDSFLPQQPTVAQFNTRLLTYAAVYTAKDAVALPPATGKLQPLRHYCSVFGGGLVALRPAFHPPNEKLLTSLKELTAILEAEGLCDHLTGGESPAPAADGGTPPPPTWKNVTDALTLPMFTRLVSDDPLLSTSYRRSCDRNNVEQELRQLQPSAGVLSRHVYVAEDAIDEDGIPCVKVSSYVQELSPPYVMDALEGKPKTPRTIAAAFQAAAAAQVVAVPSPMSPETTKKKKNEK